MLMELRLKKYARLLVEVGVNLQKGQRLVINCPVECADFARLCISAAYDAGCSEVVMNWSDDFAAREKYLRADSSVFETYPVWQREFLNGYAREGAGFLKIYASDPENLKGVDPARIASAQRVAGEAVEEYRRLQMVNGFPWCIASIPIDSWAKRVFADTDAEDAKLKLWDAIFKAVRIDEKGDPVELWRAHLDVLEERKKWLNSHRFKLLKYSNSLGTDLCVELPEGHLWEAGNERTLEGRPFVANMPTEEVFTAPKRDGVNGVVYASLPLVQDGNIIEDIKFVLKDGKIVEAYASKGEEVLRAAISVDEGASFLGEVALVPYDSPISNMGLLFYNTLFDENASCHLAFGEAYPNCIKGGSEMTKEELSSAGLNDSIAHEDFMIGTSDLSVTGVTCDGTEVPVMRDGNFVF